MSRLWTADFEAGPGSNSTYFNLGTTGTIVNSNTALSHAAVCGTYIFTGVNQRDPTFNASHQWTGVSEIYMRCYVWYVAGLPGHFLHFYESTLGSQGQNWLEFNSSDHLQVVRAGISDIVMATATNPFPSAQWVRLDIHQRFDSSGATGIIKVQVNGVDSPYGLNVSGIQTADISNNNVAIGLANPGTLQSVYFDEVAVNDTSGGSDNSWLPLPDCLNKQYVGRWG